MAPKKSTVFTSGTDKQSTRPAATRRKPLTTQGKIFKAQRDAEKALKDVSREAPDPPITSSSSGKSTKKQKAKSFAPPAELEEDAKERKMREAATARRLATKGGKWDFSKNKPITTQQKIARARAIQKGKGGVNATVAATIARRTVEESNKGLSLGEKILEAEGAKDPTMKSTMKPAQSYVGRDQSQVIGTYTMVKYHEPCVLKMERPMEREGVLVRATERARIYRRGLGRRNPVYFACESIEKDKAGQDRLLELPEEVRKRIWRFVVVEQKCFIWPTLATGREQPDLAMVCRKIREEVLPVYYRQNTFAITISPEIVPSRTHGIKTVEADNGSQATMVPLTGLAAVYKWAKVLDRGGWLSHITHWAFDYVDREAAMIATKRKADEDDESFVVCVNIDPGVDDAYLSEEDTSVPRPPKNPKIEVHREGACILPGWKNHRRCIIQNPPSEAVVAVVELMRAGKFPPYSIRQLAKHFRGMAAKLRFVRCFAKKPAEGTWVPGLRGEPC